MRESMDPRRLAGVAAGVALLLLSVGVSAQQYYMRGQNIAPAYEGWEKNADGSFNLVFGYMNRNWEEEIDLPIGPNNNIEPGGPDQGQPTHFLPRRSRFVFRVRVPADFGKKELVWTLTSNGVTERAYATLLPDYFIDSMIVQANFGGAGAGGTDPTIDKNVAPTLIVDGERTRTAKVGQPVVLQAVARDNDGLPKPRNMPPSNPNVPPRFTIDSATGLRLSWFVYRGRGAAVTFDPPQIKVWEDTRDRANSPWAPGFRTPPVPSGNTWTVRATFGEPGTYVVRCQAHDGGLATTEDVTVVVQR